MSLKPLTPAQNRAAKSRDQMTVALAVPGAGKTETLAQRAASLIQDGVSASDICLVTYTVRAAEEIRVRTARALGREVDFGYAGTLHGLCYRMLRKHAGLLGISPLLAIIDEDQRETLLDAVKRRYKLKASENMALPLRRMIPGPDRPVPATRPEIAAKDYHDRLLAGGMTDFDTILGLGRRLFDYLSNDGMKENAEWPSDLLVDEFQDASEDDFAIYMSMSCRRKFFVGDPHQSIFGFRGGSPTYLERVAESAANAGTLVLINQNWRNGAHIAKAANALALHIAGQSPLAKRLAIEATRTGGGVEAREHHTPLQETAAVVEGIRKEMAAGRPAHQIAVLVRTNASVAAFAAQLEAAGMPVARMVNKSPSDWAHARKLAAFLINPDNDFLAEWFIARKGGADAVAAAKAKAVAQLQSINRALGLMLTPMPIHEVPDWLERQGITKPTIALVRQMMDSLHPAASVGELALEMNRGAEAMIENANGVAVLTMHSAKGLEWESVWLPGWNEGAFPSGRDSRDGTLLDEARRLAYVALTRAKDAVHLSWAGNLPPHPNTERLEPASPSRFIYEAVGLPNDQREKDQDPERLCEIPIATAGQAGLDNLRSGCVVKSAPPKPA